MVSELDAHGLAASAAQPEPRALQYEDLGKLTYLSAAIKVRNVTARLPYRPPKRVPTLQCQSEMVVKAAIQLHNRSLNCPFSLQCLSHPVGTAAPHWLRFVP